jgi:hypothetical protein
MCNQGMAALGGGSDVSGSVLLTWHEKVRLRWAVEQIRSSETANAGLVGGSSRCGMYRPGHDGPTYALINSLLGIRMHRLYSIS